MIGMMLAPFFCSDAIRAYAWSRILSADGLLFRFLSSLPGFSNIDSLRFSELAVGVALCSAFLPFGVIAVVASLPAGDEDLWLASRDLGVSRFWEFWHMALPAAAPGLAVGWIFQLILASFSSVEEQYLGNSTSMQKIASGMINADVGANSLAFFALSSLILLGLTVNLMAVGWLVVTRGAITASIAKAVELMGMVAVDARTRLRRIIVPGIRPERSNLGKSLRRIFRLPGVFVFTCSILVVATYALVLAPILGAIVLAFRDGIGLAWTLQNFREAFGKGSLFPVLNRSLLLACSVGFVCMVLSVLLATILWRRFAWRAIILFLVVIGALLPAETYALGVLRVIRAIGIDSGGIWLAALGHIAWALPFSLGAVILAYQKLDTVLLEAAWEFGDGAWNILGRVILRSTLPSVLGSALFGFLLSLNEYSRGLYLGGGTEFLSTRVFGRMQSGLVGNGRQIFAMAGSLVAFSFLLCLLGVLETALARKQLNE
jgi:ABC-type spermidine/putrescine transport system permease subunit II